MFVIKFKECLLNKRHVHVRMRDSLVSSIHTRQQLHGKKMEILLGTAKFSSFWVNRYLCRNCSLCTIRGGKHNAQYRCAITICNRNQAHPTIAISTYI